MIPSTTSMASPAFRCIRLHLHGLVWFGLVWFYGTAALYRLYRAGECVVNVTESEWVCRVIGVVLHSPTCGVVPPCTLEPSVKSPSPIQLGECAEFDGTIPFYNPEQWMYYILSLAHRGQIRHYVITRNLSNCAGEYAVWMRVSACRCQWVAPFYTLEQWVNNIPSLIPQGGHLHGHLSRQKSAEICVN